MNYLKNTLLAALIIATSACSYERTNRTLTSYGEDQPEWTEAAPAEAVIENEEQIIEQRKAMAEVAKKKSWSDAYSPIW